MAHLSHEGTINNLKEVFVSISKLSLPIESLYQGKQKVSQDQTDEYLKAIDDYRLSERTPITPRTEEPLLRSNWDLSIENLKSDTQYY